MKNISKYYDDILILAGCVLVLIGVYQVSPIATWFTGGAMLIILGTITGIAKRGRNDHR